MIRKRLIYNSGAEIHFYLIQPDQTKSMKSNCYASEVNKLKNLNANVRIYDPYYKKTEVFGLKTEDDYISAITDSDAIVLITSHKEFHDLEPIFLSSKLRSGIVIDSRCTIDQNAAKTAGLIYRGIGRGKI